jgi:hypothetical protein
MIAAFIILSSLLAILPTLMMVDGTLASGVVSAVVAIALLTVAFTLHAVDLNRFSRLLGPTAFVVLFMPCVWMLLQVVPISIRALANPIWLSTSSALDKPFVGAISLDIGSTLLSLSRYCASLGAGLVTAAVTLNKPRAESILSLLTAIAGLIAIELIGFDLDYLHLPGFERADAMNIAVIGFILSCATAILAHEHFYTPGTRPKSSQMTRVAASASMAVFFICLSAILISADAILAFASVFGAGILISVSAIRKWRLGPWGLAGLAALTAVLVMGFLAIASRKDADPTLIFSTQDKLSSIERMLSDTKWAGSGAGSFEALLPIYRNSYEANSFEIPTAAATIAIEMGQPFLWACVIVFLIGALTLFRRALRRGRDYVYSSAGASCIIALLITLFSNNGILGLTASLVIGVLSGLAFAQSKSASNANLNLFEELYSIADRRNERPLTAEPMKPNSSTKIWLRVTMVLFATFLSAQAAWILLPEGYRLDHIRLPLDPKNDAIAVTERDKVKQMASFAVVRGDLWAESALTYQLGIDQAIKPSAGNNLNTEALKTLDQALRYSPHRGDVWLVFAALADRYEWQGYQPNLLLRMSYYTAPNETALFPLRLKVSLHAKGAIDDVELQDMIKRDIIVILTREPNLRPALVAAYRSALPQGKAFAEHVISEIDPGYLDVVRVGNP